MSRSTSETLPLPTQRRWGQVLRWPPALLRKPRLLWLGPLGLIQDPAAPQAEALAPADWLAREPAGGPLQLIVSEQLQQQLVCEPGLPLADAPAIAAYARQLFHHYFGAAAQRWALAPWQAGSARGAAALAGLDLAALQGEGRLRSLRPVWAQLLQRLAVDEPAWFGAARARLLWVEGALLTVLELRGGQLSALRHQRLAAPTLAALDALLAGLGDTPDPQQLLLLGYGLDAAAAAPRPGLRQLGRLDAALPDLAWLLPPAKVPAGLPRPDFIAQAARSARLAWPLALCGTLVLATAGWEAWQSQAQLQRRAAQVAGLQARLQKAPPAAARPSVQQRRQQGQQARAEQQQLRLLGEARDSLAQPWGALLATVEQAGQGADGRHLSWLGLEHAAARRELRLEGLAPDQALALQLAERLAAAPGWDEVVLTRFQQAQGGGGAAQRFELRARLQPAALVAELPLISRSAEQIAP